LRGLSLSGKTYGERQAFRHVTQWTAPFNLNDCAAVFWHNVRMPDERSLTLCQIDQARSNLYAIGDDLEFIKG
jgi:hypothetical protein